MAPSHRGRPRRMAWWKFWIILCLMFVAAGILALIAGGLLFAYNQ